MFDKLIYTNMLNSEKMFSISLLASAIFISSVAAVFSILGIGTLFSGSMISAMLMALSLEFGKLMSISFMYRYWNKIASTLKFYLTMSAIVLVAITSLGVFGWLSAAYQGSSLKYEITQ